ncbi:uncharacterized protein BDZ99DRAFT_129952 [Mytilinidion resinicola]|uniref:Uncharacterized protein n=1 Tax=Mytilinidion resinicola TaxID=574789 RepID=A0A6A6Z7C2_9PEZI|nr:uncharacterized protein BDZ99DRAFT_129952 [Mytilinidion resinicola]KAF2816155.1 hypothetical protein BDZ99DRAFT_129952 [Mytilinidion resinicola]
MNDADLDDVLKRLSSCTSLISLHIKFIFPHMSLNGFWDQYGPIVSISGFALVAFAQSHRKLKELSLGSQNDIACDRVCDYHMEEFAACLQNLTYLGLYFKNRYPGGRGDGAGITERSLESIGRHCRGLERVGIKCSTRASQMSLLQPCLFPKLQRLMLGEQIDRLPRMKSIRDLQGVLEKHCPRLRMLGSWITVGRSHKQCRGLKPYHPNKPVQLLEFLQQRARKVRQKPKRRGMSMDMNVDQDDHKSTKEHSSVQVLVPFAGNEADNRNSSGWRSACEAWGLRQPLPDTCEIYEGEDEEDDNSSEANENESEADHNDGENDDSNSDTGEDNYYTAWPLREHDIPPPTTINAGIAITLEKD